MLCLLEFWGTFCAFPFLVLSYCTVCLSKARGLNVQSCLCSRLRTMLGIGWILQSITSLWGTRIATLLNWERKKMPQGQCQTYFTIASLRHVYRNISHLKKAIFFSSSNFNFLWLHPFLPGPEQDIKLKKTRSLLLSSSWLGGKTLPRWSHLPIKNTVISRHSCNPLPFTNQRAQWGDI